MKTMASLVRDCWFVPRDWLIAQLASVSVYDPHHPPSRGHRMRHTPSLAFRHPFRRSNPRYNQLPPPPPSSNRRRANFGIWKTALSGCQFRHLENRPVWVPISAFGKPPCLGANFGIWKTALSGCQFRHLENRPVWVPISAFGKPPCLGANFGIWKTALSGKRRDAERGASATRWWFISCRHGCPAEQEVCDCSQDGIQSACALGCDLFRQFPLLG